MFFEEEVYLSCILNLGDVFYIFCGYWYYVVIKEELFIYFILGIYFLIGIDLLEWLIYKL